MDNQPDNANAVVRPPIMLLSAFLLGLLADWLYPLKFVPAAVPNVLLGSFIFIDGLALVVWAITTIRAAGTHVQTSQPTTAIVAEGPYRFSRNPIYLGMFLGLIGLAIAFNTIWILGRCSRSMRSSGIAAIRRKFAAGSDAGLLRPLQPELLHQPAPLLLLGAAIGAQALHAKACRTGSSRSSRFSA